MKSLRKKNDFAIFTFISEFVDLTDLFFDRIYWPSLQLVYVFSAAWRLWNIT